MVCPSGKVKLFFIGFKFVLHNFAIVKTMQTLCIMKRILTTLMAILLMCLTGLSFADEVTKIIIIEKPIVSEGNKTSIVLQPSLKSRVIILLLHVALNLFSHQISGWSRCRWRIRPQEKPKTMS